MLATIRQVPRRQKNRKEGDPKYIYILLRYGFEAAATVLGGFLLKLKHTMVRCY